jgi:hypothetical protein
VSDRFGEGVHLANQWTMHVKYDYSGTFAVSVGETAACRAFEALHGIDVDAQTLGDPKGHLARESDSISFRTDSTEELAPDARRARGTKAELDQLYPESVAASVFQHVSDLVPRFFHFDEYGELMGRTGNGPLIDALRSHSEPLLDDSQRTASLSSNSGSPPRNWSIPTTKSAEARRRQWPPT